MGNEKWTPGPWTENDCLIMRGRDWIGTTVGGMTGSNSREQNRANARLIAAAPCLAEALEAIERRLTEVGRAFYGSGTRKALESALNGWVKDAETARAALAKARGEAK